MTKLLAVVAFFTVQLTGVAAHAQSFVRQDDGKMVLAKLPMTLLIDAKGKVVKRIDGRVAPEAWDDVAELLL